MHKIFMQKVVALGIKVRSQTKNTTTKQKKTYHTRNCILLYVLYIVNDTTISQPSNYHLHAPKKSLKSAYLHSVRIKVKNMQRSGTEAIRTQIQPSKPKREITKITNSQNTKRTYGQRSAQLFPKRCPLSNRNRTKNNTNTR